MRDIQQVGEPPSTLAFRAVVLTAGFVLQLPGGGAPRGRGSIDSDVTISCNGGVHGSS